jgi:hypothetical protein
MTLGHGSRIVLDGLLVCLDAANPKSYPGTGTVWTDLSGNGNNGTLINGPTFNSENKGRIVFDGVDDRVDISSNFNTFGAGLGSGFTASYWLKTTDTTFTQFSGIVNNGFNLIWAVNFNRGVEGRDNFSPGATQFYIRAQTTNLFLVGYILTDIYDGKWYNLVWTCTNPANNTYVIYVNGISQSVTYTDTQSPNTWANFNYPLPISANNARGSFTYAATEVAQVAFYDRALTAEEVQKNFNTLKGRFSI